MGAEDRLPLWVRSVLANAKGCLLPQLERDAANDAARLSLKYAEQSAKQLRNAWQATPILDRLDHDWLQSAGLEVPERHLLKLADLDWKHAKVRFADRVIRSTVDMAMEVCERFAPRLQHDAAMVKIATVIELMRERLLGTDAMMDRHKVRYSVRMLARELGSRAGSMVGDAIVSKRHPSEVFAHIAFVFAADIWRFWADADPDPSKEYEHLSAGHWGRFVLQRTNCILACEAAMEMHPGQNDSDRITRVREHLAREFDGDEVSSVLTKAWILARTSDPSPFGDEWAELGSTLSYLKKLRCCSSHALAIRSMTATFRATGKKPIPPPRWGARLAERLYWQTVGSELYEKEFGHIWG